MKSVIKTAKTVEEAVRLGLLDLGLREEDCQVEVLSQPKTGVLGIFGAKDAIVKISEKDESKFNIDIISDEINKSEEFIKKPLISNESKEIDGEYYQKDDNKLFEATNIEKSLEQSTKQEKMKEEDLDESELHQDMVSDDSLLDMDEIGQLAETKLSEILTAMHIDAKVKYRVDRESIKLELFDISEEDTGIVIGKRGETLDSLQYIINIITNRYAQDYIRVSLDVSNYRVRRKKAIENNAKKTAFRVIKNKKSFSLEPMNSYERRIVHYTLQDYKEIETISKGKFPNRKVIIKYKG